MRHLWASIGLAGVLLGCATTQHQEPSSTAESPPAGASSAVPALSSVTIDQEFGTLGELVRNVGEQSSGGLVLMHGLEPTPAPRIVLQNAPFSQLVAGMTKANGLAAQANGAYYFIHLPLPLYEPLLALDLHSQLPDHYRNLKATVSYGGGTALFNVLATLSKTLDITLVADNIVSESACGELALPDAPLPDILEAVFKSALLPAANFKLQATEDYLLFTTPGNALPQDLLLNAASLTAEQQALLDRVVQVEVPHPMAQESEAVFMRGAAKLGNVLPVLSEQLGVQVQISPSLKGLPVTWTVMNHVKVRTALELLIWQWPVPNFGYEILDNAILIRERSK